MNDNPNVPTENLDIDIVGSYDMGWQELSTGHIYDWLSWHGFMIGCIRLRKYCLHEWELKMQQILVCQ